MVSLSPDNYSVRHTFSALWGKGELLCTRITYYAHIHTPLRLFDLSLSDWVGCYDNCGVLRCVRMRCGVCGRTEQ